MRRGDWIALLLGAGVVAVVASSAAMPAADQKTNGKTPDPDPTKAPPPVGYVPTEADIRRSEQLTAIPPEQFTVADLRDLKRIEGAFHALNAEPYAARAVHLDQIAEQIFRDLDGRSYSMLAAYLGSPVVPPDLAAQMAVIAEKFRVFDNRAGNARAAHLEQVAATGDPSAPPPDERSRQLYTLIRDTIVAAKPIRPELYEAYVQATGLANRAPITLEVFYEQLGRRPPPPPPATPSPVLFDLRRSMARADLARRA